MDDKNIKHIFFVDDEPKVREVVGETLEQLEVKVSCFPGGQQCLENFENQKCDLLITDLKMPGMDGLELMQKAKEMAPWLPVLVITGYGDIPVAVRSIKIGAVDFIEKPLEKETFLRKVKSILKNNSINKYNGKPLTATESKIFRMVIDGKSNREIAELLHRSIRTIEVHRANVMQKFGVENLVDLIKEAVMFGLVEMENNKQSKNKQNKTYKENEE